MAGIYNPIEARKRRLDQRGIASTGVRSQNTQIILGNPKDGYLKIDYQNKRIIINDGTNDRVLIGFQSGGF